jgi:hypothetical protein
MRVIVYNFAGSVGVQEFRIEVFERDGEISAKEIPGGLVMLYASSSLEAQSLPDFAERMMLDMASCEMNLGGQCGQKLSRVERDE